MRERIELRRALRLPWLVQLASERDATSVAMNGSAGSQPPSSLALDAQNLARAQKELRIPKQEVLSTACPESETTFPVLWLPKRHPLHASPAIRQQEHLALATN